MLKVLIPILVLASFGLASASIIPEEKVNGEVCQLCTIVLTFAQQYLESNATDQEVISFIDNQLCSKLGALSATCKTYVDAYGAVIIYQLAQKIDPSIVCHNIGLCATAVSQVKLNVDTCAACKFGLHELQTALTNPNTQKYVFGFVNKNLCANLKGELSSACVQIVNNFGSYALVELAKLINPEQLCNQVKLCSARSFQALVKPVAKANPNCLLCQLTIKQVEAELESGKTQQEIVNFLQGKCDLLPAEFHTPCTAVLAAYGPQIIKMVADYLAAHQDPTTVCKELKLCD